MQAGDDGGQVAGTLPQGTVATRQYREVAVCPWCATSLLCSVNVEFVPDTVTGRIWELGLKTANRWLGQSSATVKLDLEQEPQPATGYEQKRQLTLRELRKQEEVEKPR